MADRKMSNSTRWVIWVLMVTPLLATWAAENPYDYQSPSVSHHREKRARRAYMVRCCGSQSCTGPLKKGWGLKNGATRTRPRNRVTGPDRRTDIIDTNDPNLVTVEPPPPIACAQLNFGSLSSCCQLHPTIFDYMDPDIRTCTNRTSSEADFIYYKTILIDYMLNQAVTMKNKLDLRRIPNAVKFYDCFFSEREWLGATSKGEIFNPAMTDEFIDNVDSSWDDLLTDALLNCSKVIKALVPWPYIQLPTREDPSIRQNYQTYPILVAQCVRKVLLSYCPAPNRPMLTPACNDMRSKFRVCDPFQQTADPPEPGDGNNNGGNPGGNNPNNNADEYYYDDEETGAPAVPGGGGGAPPTSSKNGKTPSTLSPEEEYYDESNAKLQKEKNNNEEHSHDGGEDSGGGGEEEGGDVKGHDGEESRDHGNQDDEGK